MAVKAHRLGPGSLKLGLTGTEQEFSAQMTNGRLSPSAESEDPIPVLSGEEVAGDDTFTWVLAGTLLQSYDKAGLLHWAFENRGVAIEFDFVPSTVESDYGWRGTVKVVPLEIGGDVKTRNTSDFEFRLVGEPETYDIPEV